MVKSSKATPTKTKSTTAPPKQQKSSSNNTAAGEYLLERLRILLNRLQSTTEILQSWPETKGDSAKRHFDTATDLIASIRKIVLALRAVERHVNGTGPSNKPGGGGENTNAALAAISKEALEAFRTSLEDKCPIPLDLLDLLDVGQPFGMNPQCYARGLMKESMRQLAGLERRKRALAMLKGSIEEGMEQMGGRVGTSSNQQSMEQSEGGNGKVDVSEQKNNQQQNVDAGGEREKNTKRKRDDELDEAESLKKMPRTE